MGIMLPYAPGVCAALHLEAVGAAADAQLPVDRPGVGRPFAEGAARTRQKLHAPQEGLRAAVRVGAGAILSHLQTQHEKLHR